jgi:hypothetical protein
MKRWVLLLALLVAVGVPTATAQPGPNIVVNGDFEVTAPLACPGPPGFVIAPPTVIADWTVTKDTVDVVCTTLLQAQSLLQSIDLTGSPGQGKISQLVPTISDDDEGNEYLLTFWMAGNPGCDGDVKRMDVWWEGVVIATHEFNTAGKSGQNMGWVQLQHTVTDTGLPGSLLEFESKTGNFCGPMIDNVSVQQIDDDDGDGEDDDEDGEDEDGDGDDDDGDPDDGDDDD